MYTLCDTPWGLGRAILQTEAAVNINAKCGLFTVWFITESKNLAERRLGVQAIMRIQHKQQIYEGSQGGVRIHIVER